MLFRAVFWIGLISMVMPREPDVGYGRPNPGADMATDFASWTRNMVMGQSPAKQVDRQIPTRTLAQIKAEIAAARHPS